VTEFSSLLIQIGEPVSIFYEPRNEGNEWVVSLARVPMLHEHFGSLEEGLRWLADNRPRFTEWEKQIEQGSPKET